MTTPDPIPKSTHLHYLRQTITLAQKSPPKPTNFRVGCVLVSYPASPPLPQEQQRQQQQPSSTQSSNPNPETDIQVHGKVLSTGYTLELPGNTHAEQCALEKLQHSSPSSLSSSSTTGTKDPSPSQPQNPDSDIHGQIYLYTSLEPCSLRLSGNTPCVQRIINTTFTTSTSTSTSNTSTTPTTSPITTTTDSSSSGSSTNIKHVIFGAKEPGTFVQDSQSCRILTDAGVAWTYLPEYEGEILRVAMEGHDRTSTNTNTSANTDTDTDTNRKTGMTEESRKEEEEEQTKKSDDIKGVVGNEVNAAAAAAAAAGERTRIDDISEEERKRQEALPRNPKKRMMDTGV